MKNAAAPVNWTLDTRDDSPTRGRINEFFLGVQNPTLVQIPNLVYHGWKCIGREPSPPYDWTRKDG